MNRPKDGMFSRFTGPVMDQIRGLVPDFPNIKEADKMYSRLIKLKRVQKLVEAQRASIESGTIPGAEHLPYAVSQTGRPYRCSAQVSLGEIDLADSELNPMELLHIMAHFLQPGGGSWHGGEFGKTFLELIERQYGPEMKRSAKDIMIANKIKTTVLSSSTREKQSERFFDRKVAKAPEGLAKILQEMRKLQEDG